MISSFPWKGNGAARVGDIADAAALELLRRHRAETPLGREVYELTGPHSLTGSDIASIWSDALGRSIRYGGDDLVAMEQRLKAMLPNWHAMDLRLMFSRYQTDGAAATADDLARLTTLLGRAPRSYREFATDAAAQWIKG
jgi:uncharacterized protein YbjT (DUF2867 family)